MNQVGRVMAQTDIFPWLAPINTPNKGVRTDCSQEKDELKQITKIREIQLINKYGMIKEWRFFIKKAAKLFCW